MFSVVLHCSASSWGNAAVIDYWHRSKGWNSNGYHRVFLNGKLTADSPYNARLDGHMETGREYGVTGAHTIGHNHKAGFCLIGESGKFTPAQIRAVKAELRELAMEHGGVRVTQHSDHDRNKPFCAGFTQYEMAEFNKI